MDYHINSISRDNVGSTAMFISGEDGFRPASIADFASAATISGLAMLLEEITVNRTLPATGATMSAVAASTSGQLLLPANTARRGSYIYNDSVSLMFIGYATGVSSSLFTYALPPSGAYETPLDYYNGNIYGVWGTATGQALVTELR